MSNAVLENKPSVPEEIPSFTATLIIRRFNPDVDDEPYWQDFDVEMHGTTIPAGSKALVLLGSANRDERVFTDPTVYDVHRPKSELGQILSFGSGKHFCLGANLARLETRVVLNELVRRVEDVEVHADRAVRVHSTSVRGFAELPTGFTLRKG